MTMTQNQPAQTSIAPEEGLLRRLGGSALLGLFWSFAPPLGSIVLFTFINPIGDWLRGHDGMLGLVLYAIGFVVLVGIGLLPTYASAILGAWAFGFAFGYPAALVGFCGAALVGYTIGRRVSGEKVEAEIRRRPKWAAVRDALIARADEHQGFWRTVGIVALVRMPINSPFALTNLVLSSIKTPRAAFLLGTLIGMSPRTAAVALFAVKLQNMVAEEAAAQRLPREFVIPGIAASIFAFVVIGWIAKRALDRVVKNAASR